MSHRRPRLALPFTILTGTATVRLVAGEDFRYTLSGPRLETWLPAWLSGMDGRATLEEAIARLPQDLQATARALTDQLYGERVLIDGVAADAHGVSRVELLLEGSATWAVDWQPPIHSDAIKLPVHCQDRLDYDAALRANRRHLAANARWLWSSTGPMGRAYVSPLFLPDAGPCLECLLNHFRRLSPVPELYDDFIRLAESGGTIAPVPFPVAAIEIVRQLLVWKATLVELPDPPAALYRLHVVELATLEISSHRVFVDPECPACGGRN